MNWDGGYTQLSVVGGRGSLPAYYGDSRWSPPNYDHQVGSAGSSSSSNSVEESALPSVEATFPADELVASLNHLIDSDRSSASPLSEYGYNTYGLSDLSLNPAAVRLTPSPPQIIPNYSIPSPVPQVTLPQPPRCVNHLHSSQFLYCKTCSEAFCMDCGSCRHLNHVTDHLMEVVDYAGQQASQMMNDARLTMGLLRTDFDKNQLALDSSQSKAREVSDHVRETFRQIIQSLEAREKELLEQIENHRIDKTKVLRARDDTLRNCINKLKKSVDALAEASRSPSLVTNPENLLKWKDIASGEIFNVRQLRSSLPIIEENWLTFEAPSSTAQQALGSLGSLTFRAPRYVSSSLTSNNGRNNQLNYSSYQHGSHRARSGSLSNNTERSSARPIVPVPRGRAIPGNGPPVPFAAATRRTFAENCKAIRYIGSTGKHPGESLCRPWGVACDREGNLVVADRSNARIVIFRQDGSVVRSFGSLGKAPGQLDRPAGVAVDSRRRIIVADKDNHRIQVFTMEGEYLFGFGHKGLAPGQFNYPWDVAVNSECQIAVTDSRNHRVQLFSPEGIFLRKYGFEGTSSAQHKHFDSPRGITFNSEGQILVNDFNNHRIVLIDSDMMNAKILIGDVHGSHKTLQRPQGLTVDDQGNIYVADSKNHRIAMFDKAGVFKWKFGSFDNEGNRPDGMDRPSGIALTPEGKIALIDFGNNRLQLI